MKAADALDVLQELGEPRNHLRRSHVFMYYFYSKKGNSQIINFIFQQGGK